MSITANISLPHDATKYQANKLLSPFPGPIVLRPGLATLFKARTSENHRILRSSRPTIRLDAVNHSYTFVWFVMDHKGGCRTRPDKPSGGVRRVALLYKPVSHSI